jgi:phospholipid/cholesterol/gamma-HCH transport system substrate-binding protein
MIRRCAALVVLALVAAGCNLPGQVTGSVHLTATFDDVGDLVTGHSVQVADVRIGSVTGIELTKDFRARVTMAVKKNLHLPVDSTAVLRTTSLLGEKFIELRAPEGDRHGPYLHDGDTVRRTSSAPELEFVAEQAIGLLGAVTAQDVGSMVRTGAQAFGGRATELRALIDDLATISHTLADQTGNIVRIIDGLDKATQTLAAGAPEVSDLLTNLNDTTKVLADNRQQAIDAIRQLTRLATVQNEAVLDPFTQDVSRQIKQLDAIVNEVAQGRQEVGTLLDWLARFVPQVPLGVPNDFAQVYSQFVVAPTEAPK